MSRLNITVERVDRMGVPLSQSFLWRHRALLIQLAFNAAVLAAFVLLLWREKGCLS